MSGFVCDCVQHSPGLRMVMTTGAAVWSSSCTITGQREIRHGLSSLPVTLVYTYLRFAIFELNCPVCDRPHSEPQALVSTIIRVKFSVLIIWLRSNRQYWPQPAWRSNRQPPWEPVGGRDSVTQSKHASDTIDSYYSICERSCHLTVWKLRVKIKMPAK